jgi:SAP domain-containing ribonucleoprotein
LLESTQDLLKSPDSSKSTTPDSVVPAKKVSLKRNVSIPLELFDTKIEETDDKKDESEEPEKKVVKISTMSALDRLEMRAKKFGGGSAAVSSSSSTSDVASQSKLEARAARFGLSASSNQTAAVSSSSPATADILKKRAERFGAITSDAKKSELDEKLQKRKERFGNAGKVTVPSGTSADYEEKARLRLERFKQTA